MVLLVLLIGIVMLMFWRGLSCVQPLLYASLAVCTSLLWHWTCTALCGFGARPLLTVLSVAIAAGSFLRSSCVDFVIEAVSCGLWTAHFILIRNSRALSVSILSTSVVPCRLEGLSMIVLYCSRFLIVLAYFYPPFGIPKKSTTCKQTSCLMVCPPFGILPAFSKRAWMNRWYQKFAQAYYGPFNIPLHSQPGES